MGPFTLQNWPLMVVSAGMILAAIIDGWKLKVPNWLTFPLILSGWALGILHDCGVQLDAGQGGFLASLAATTLGFFLLFPLLLINGMGQGDVKMQMGFGAWVGAFFGFPNGLLVLTLAFCVGGIIGGIIGLAMMVVRRSYRETASNMRLILTDMFVLGSFNAMAQRGTNLRQKGPKLPYGVPLCLGFVGYLLYLYYSS